MEKAWVDGDLCRGCGVCAAACSVGAIHLVGGKALVDGEACTGCGACVAACPTGAIQMVVQGELVPADEAAPPTAYRPSPLRTAGAAAAFAGAGWLARSLGSLARRVGRQLLSRPAASGVTRPTGEGTPTFLRPSGGRGGRGHRRRWRGGL